MSAKLSAAIDRLAGLYEYGHLQADTSPDEFLEQVADEIAALRAENDSAKEALEVALATIYSWAIDGHADWCESQCSGDHCTCGHVGAREMLEIPRPEGE